MVISESNLDDKIKGEVEPLLHSHMLEIEHYSSHEISVDWSTYDKLFEVGLFKLFTVRHNGELIGYASYILNPSLRYKGIVQAISDALYVKPEFRKGMTGYKLLKYAMQNLGNAHSVYQSVPVTQSFGPLLTRLGLTSIENIYTKEL